MIHKELDRAFAASHNEHGGAFQKCCAIRSMYFDNRAERYLWHFIAGGVTRSLAHWKVIVLDPQYVLYNSM